MRPSLSTPILLNSYVSHVSNVLSCLRRINTLSSFVDKQAHVYALGRILSTATWGKYAPFTDHRSELCNPITNEPIVIWTVGHVASTWFERNGELEKQASITVIPLSDSLQSQTSKLLNGLAYPPLHKPTTHPWHPSITLCNLQRLRTILWVLYARQNGKVSEGRTFR